MARTVPPELVEVTGAGALTVRRGQNRWSYSECRAARFDAAYFDADHFAGGPCTEEAVFDLSRFDNGAVFATGGARTPTAHVRIDWDSHQPGRLRVNLPAELDRRFGVAFGVRGRLQNGTAGEGRFGTREPLRFEGVVTEPNEDDNHIVKRVNEAETVIEAKPAPFVPIGWSPVAMPFRDPMPLTLGDPDTPAALYLSEPGLGTGFVKLEAAEPGAFGNEITVTCRAAGPAIYDLEVSFPGGRFEVARSVAFGVRGRPRREHSGPPLPTLADALLQPGPAGVGTAKAAGIHADITRDRVYPAEEGTP